MRSKKTPPQPRIYTLDQFLRETFGEKIVKLSLDGGFTCPNRDGTKGTGGCIFCSPAGSGEHTAPLEEQIVAMKTKWPAVGHYLAYFQNFTATYADPAYLRKLYDDALAHPEVVGLVVATRPDCLPAEVLDVLEDYAQKTFLWVELGLQTIYGDNLNRGYDLADYNRATQALAQRQIPFVTHLILGLPGESREDMEASTRYVTSGQHCPAPFGLKFHLLNVAKGAPLADLYPGYTPFETLEDYVSLVCDLLELVPPTITIHRMTGDVPYKDLIAPTWSYKKRTILNGISHEMARRNAYQGDKL